MSSIAPTEFLSFPKLPPELREMVWDEALPTLDLQRFNAEIAPHPDSPTSSKFKDLVLCLTPHDNFVQLTSGYVGLLGACRESRWAAIAGMKCCLPINYIARGADGSVAVRFAKVPYNPDGRLCISGLGSAFRDAAEEYGARGIDLPSFNVTQALMNDIQCPTFAEIRNLTISFTLRDTDRLHSFLLGWEYRFFDNMAKRMDKLETVMLVAERWMDERHRIDAKDFESLHKPAAMVRSLEGGDGWDYELNEHSTVKIPWRQLFYDFTLSLSTFRILTSGPGRSKSGLPRRRFMTAWTA